MALSFLCKIEKHSNKDFGGKGNGLKQLLSLGIPILESYALPLSESGRILEVAPPPLSFPLIIRSSANIEDAESFSFAGAFQSLVVSSASEWATSLNAVVESMTSFNLHELFLSQGIDPQSVRPGIVVQQWIPTRKRGVLFTRDPRQIWAEESLIEWAEENDSVVEGEHPTRTLRACTTDEEPFRSLLKIGRELETKLKSPLDLEWGVDHAGSLIFFQCRPISGPHAHLLRRVLQKPDARWSRTLSQERFPECLTPLGWDVIRDGIPTNFASMADYFGFRAGDPNDLALSDEGWIYNSETFFKFPGGIRLNLIQFLKRRPWFIAKAMIALVGSLFHGKRWKSFLGVTLAEAIISPLKATVQNDFTAGLQEILKLLNALDSFSHGRTKADLQRQIQTINQCARIFLHPDFPIFLSRELLFKSYQSLWTSEAFQASFVDVVSRLPHNISLQSMGDQEALRFSRTSWDVFYPSVSDQTQTPTPVIRKGYSEAMRLSPEWKTRIENLQTWMSLDEELHHYTGVLIEATRRVMLRAGELMVESKILAHREDIFFLQLSEVHAWLAGHIAYPLTALSARRRARFEVRRKIGPPSELPPRSESLQIESKGMSRGIVTGKVLAVAHYHEIDALPDEPFILATPSANPAWINLFPKIQGWITEAGGPLAHGFVAARDYGIPAITGVEFETLKSLSGKTIRLDGARGEFTEASS